MATTVAMAPHTLRGEGDRPMNTQHQAMSSSAQLLDVAMSYAASGRARYTKGELLGRGACKTVYKAFDESEGMERAWNEVTVNAEFNALDEKERERIFAEIRLLKQLKHKNVLALYDYWLDRQNGTLVFITELFMDGSLRSYRRKHKNVDTQVIKRWAWQILQGLVYLHGHNPPIIHRDLKSDNIFVNGASGTLKIGDLGFATFRAGFSGAMSVIGTPEFMAPELYEERYDEKVDIYSFGLCLMELATLEYPYSECRNAAQIFKKVTQGVPPQGLTRIVDDELREFVMLCIQHDPIKRPEARQLLKHPFFEAVRESSVRRLGGIGSFAGGSSAAVSQLAAGAGHPLGSASMASLVSAVSGAAGGGASTSGGGLEGPQSSNSSGAGTDPLVRRTPSSPGSLAHATSVTVAALPQAQARVEHLHVRVPPAHPAHGGSPTADRSSAGPLGGWGYSQPSPDVSGGGGDGRASHASQYSHVTAGGGGAGGPLPLAIAAAARASTPSGTGLLAASLTEPGDTARTSAASTQRDTYRRDLSGGGTRTSTGLAEMSEEALLYGDDGPHSVDGQGSSRTSANMALLDRRSAGAMGLSPTHMSMQRSKDCAQVEEDTSEEEEAEEWEDSEDHLGQRVRLACRTHHDNMLAFSMSFINHSGTRKKVGFQYDMDADTAAEVASEMIENLSLNSNEAGFIANLIQKEIQKYHVATGVQREPHALLDAAARQALESSLGAGTIQASNSMPSALEGCLPGVPHAQAWPATDATATFPAVRPPTHATLPDLQGWTLAEGGAGSAPGNIGGLSHAAGAAGDVPLSTPFSHVRSSALTLGLQSAKSREQLPAGLPGSPAGRPGPRVPAALGASQPLHDAGEGQDDDEPSCFF